MTTTSSTKDTALARQAIETYLQTLLDLSKYPSIIAPDHNQVLKALDGLIQLHFPRPAWSADLKDILIDWPGLFIEQREKFEQIHSQKDQNKINYSALYWSDERNSNADQTLTRLQPNSTFLSHNYLIARVLSTLLQHGMYIVRFKPEYFSFYENHIECSWDLLAVDALTEKKRQLAKTEVGWVHGALRKLELSADTQPAAAVTHAFAYALFYTLTRLPPAQHQGALLEQVDRFRLYNPLLTANLRDFWRHYLQLPVNSKETPLECWQALQDLLTETHNQNKSSINFAITEAYDIGGDSVYGRRKQSNSNEDVFFSISEIGAALLGVADGVSTADLGKGRIASHAIKCIADDYEQQWKQRIQALLAETDITARQLATEQLINDFFQQCQQAVLTEINHYLDKSTDLATEDSAAIQPMSSTLVIAVIIGQSVTIGHWGDSRAYKISQKQIIRLTEDHNQRNEQLQKSAHELFSPLPQGKGSELTRVVGQCHLSEQEKSYMSNQQKVSIDHCTLLANEYLLLCSDGLLNIDQISDEITAEIELMQQVSKQSSQSCREIARQLVRKADDVHGVDNITALLLSLPSQQQAKPNT